MKPGKSYFRKSMALEDALKNHPMFQDLGSIKILSFVDVYCIKNAVGREGDAALCCASYDQFKDYLAKNLAVYGDGATELLIDAYAEAGIIQRADFFKRGYLFDMNVPAGVILTYTNADFPNDGKIPENGYVQNDVISFSACVKMLNTLGAESELLHLEDNPNAWKLIEFLTLYELIQPKRARKVFGTDDGYEIWPFHDRSLLWDHVLEFQLYWLPEDVPPNIYNKWCNMIRELADRKVVEIIENNPQFVGYGVRPGLYIYPELYELKKHMKENLVTFDEQNKEEDVDA